MSVKRFRTANKVFNTYPVLEILLGRFDTFDLP